MATSFPGYQSPPVIEVVLGAQFKPLAKLRNAHLGVFWKSLGNGWPEILEVSPLELRTELFPSNSDMRQSGIPSLRFSSTPNVRVQIRKADESRMIQLQNGRIHFNWLGHIQKEYPRFPAIQEEFTEILEKFSRFLSSENLGEFQPDHWEVTYLNHIPKGTVWNSPKDLSFIRLLDTGVSFQSGLKLEGIQSVWQFEIPPERGRLYVSLKNGVEDHGELREVAVLDLTTRGKVEKEGDRITAVIQGQLLGREIIVTSFQAMMTDAANTYWGLQK